MASDFRPKPSLFAPLHAAPQLKPQTYHPDIEIRMWCFRCEAAVGGNYPLPFYPAEAGLKPGLSSPAFIFAERSYGSDPAVI